LNFLVAEESGFPQDSLFICTVVVKCMAGIRLPQLPITDTPEALKPGLGGVGEDETANVDWPPALLF
jgi:hypothetical protein